MSILEQHAALKKKCDAMLKDARQNENVLRRFQNFEIQLMDAESLIDFINILMCQSKTTFQWDIVTLTLVDPQYDIRRIFDQADRDSLQDCDLFFIQDNSGLIRIYQRLLSPLLTRYQADIHNELFPDNDTKPASIALLPLLHRDRLIGSFNIGSYDQQRFDENSGSDFLRHLAAVIAVCLDNNLSREHLKYLGLIDNLTGVNNRRFFDQRLSEEIARVLRNGLPSSCLFIDADYFKNINDTHGHQSGDEVLHYIAQIVRKEVRQIDVVARYGGEEFVVLLQGTGQQKALEIAERIRLEIAGESFRDGTDNKIPLTVSIGISTLFPEQIEDEGSAARVFIEQADQALYHAKTTGRNKTVCFSDQLPSSNDTSEASHP